MRVLFWVTLSALLTVGTPAFAHFGMIVPKDNLVTKDGPKEVALDIRFWHPMENNGMNMEKPALDVVDRGKKQDISNALAPRTVDGKQTWTAKYAVSGPGVFAFAVTPKPYWEGVEDHYIVHLSKTIVSAFGDEEGWDRPVGLKMEIVPMVKPFALYAGNVFTGKVLYKGKPLPNCRVEVEFFNKDGRVKAPTEAYVTQTVTTDASGVFTYGAPWAGWWGFAALTTDDVTLKKDGQDKNVEIGGILWTYFHPVPSGVRQ